MMMKIFGAALIISGGFFLGKGVSDHWKKRLEVINGLYDIFSSFDLKLRKERISPDDFFSNQGELGAKILACDAMEGIKADEMKCLRRHLECLRKNSHREAVVANETYIAQLKQTVEKIKEEVDSSGKAFPLMSVAGGILLVVILI